EQLMWHAARDAHDLPWIWLGEDRTQVGFGARQKVMTGSEMDAASQKDQLPQLDCMIPIYTVTGSLGKTTTTRLLSQLLQGSGLRVGMTTSFGAWGRKGGVSEGGGVAL